MSALEDTLAHAVREVPYYRRHFGTRWRGVTSVAQLPRLPLLTKAEAVAHQAALVARGVGDFVGVVSSGTSAAPGLPLRVPRVPAEQRALEQAFPEAPEDGLVLEVRAVHHGLSHLAPRPGWLRVPWTYSANSLRLVEDVLSRPARRGARVTDLLINAGALMPLTTHLLAKGVTPSDFGLRSLSTTSFRLSPHWRARVASAWGCPVFDNYSLSEIPSAALECLDCGFNHFGAPPVLTEVLDPATRKPLARGTGVLVLTTLYPFVQAMPLIRYWTGDLVTLGPRCPVNGTRGLRFRGRLSQSLVARGAVLVAAQDVVDALEAEPLVARHPHPCEVLASVATCDAGAVKWEGGLRARSPRVQVELKFSPRAYPEAAEALGQRVAAQLLNASPSLRALEQSGRGELEVALCGPGALTKAWTKW